MQPVVKEKKDTSASVEPGSASLAEVEINVIHAMHNETEISCTQLYVDVL